MDGAIKAILLNKYGALLDLDDCAIGDVPNKAIVQWPKDMALRMISEKKQNVRMKFISFWRDGISPDWNRNRTPLARRGMVFDLSGGAGTTTQRLQMIPVKYNYSIYYWTRDLEHNQRLIEEHMWWQHTFPNLQFVFNGTYPLQPQIHFDSIVDESTVDSMLDKGLYFVTKAPITVDGWLIKSEDPTSQGLIEKVVLYIKDKDNLIEYDYATLIDEDASIYDEQLADALHLGSKVIE
jgi:hypothetical protein